MSALGATIRIAAAVIRDDMGQFLLVRKRGTTAFMQAGGKIEPGETPATALVRELHEELGLCVAEADLRYLGCHRAPAVNEPGHIVEAELFELASPRVVISGGEIEDFAWVHPDEARDVSLAPLTRDHVMPMHAIMPS